METQIYTCRACGFREYFCGDPWGENDCCPSYEICSCCGCEFGNDDWTIESTKEYREEWLKSGGEFLYPEDKPPNWNLEEQLKNIPEKYR